MRKYPMHFEFDASSGKSFKDEKFSFVKALLSSINSNFNIFSNRDILNWKEPFSWDIAAFSRKLKIMYSNRFRSQ